MNLYAKGLFLLVLFGNNISAMRYNSTTDAKSHAMVKIGGDYCPIPATSMPSHSSAHRGLEGMGGTHRPYEAWQATSNAMRTGISSTSHLPSWHPDYVNVDQIPHKDVVSHTINAEIKTYQNWQLAGEKQKLLDKQNELQTQRGDRSKVQPQIDALNKIIQDPLTDVLHTIKTADFDTALKTFEDYKTQLTQVDQVAEIQTSIQDSHAEIYGQGDLNKHAGFQAAQKLFKARSDYKLETIKNNIAKKAIEFRQAQLEKFNEQCRQFIEQDKAVSELNACIDTWSDQLTSEHAAVYKNRIDAAHAVVTQHTTSIQRYDLSNQATTMLKDFGLDAADFTTLNGNALQQVLHDEFVSILNKLAPIHTKYQHIESIHQLNKMAIECVDIGRQYNQLNKAAMASQLADFSRHVAIVQDIMVGIAEGVGQGAVNVSHAAMHPIETIQHVAQGAATAFKGLLYASMEQAEIEWAIKFDDLDAAEIKIAVINERFERIESVIKNKLAEMSARNISREITSLGTEFYLQGKLLGVVGEFFEFAQQQATTIIESVNLLQDERALFSTVEGIPVHIADGALNVAKAEYAQLQNMDKIVGGTQKVLSTEQSLLEIFAKDLLGKLEKEIEQLRNVFDFQRKGFGKAANKFLKFDYQHILGFDLYFNKKGVLKFGGLHHDFMNVIEKSDAFKFTNKIMHKNGFYQADVLVDGRFFKGKTFFPASWSREKVINVVCEAYDNFIKHGVKFVEEPGGKYRIHGYTTQGVEIEMFVTENGLITSAYPLL